MEGTRETLLADLHAWSRERDGPRIFWLSGMAGTGKSAIARSFCRTLKDEGSLGASFFCSRTGSQQSDVSRILPTLATFLARSDLNYRSALLEVLETFPDVGYDNLDLQIARLLEKPFAVASGNTDSGCDER